MRRSASLLIPLTLILMYYGIIMGLVLFVADRYPGLEEYLPLGGVDELPGANIDSFEPVYTSVERNLLTGSAPIRLLFASIGATLLAIPVSWAYFITSRARRIDQSFLQTILVLPLLVTGIAMIVLNSIALAFSLAGVVAAVRFRFSLNQPSDAMYIFVAIGIGLGSGIGAVGVAFVISLMFVLATLVIWKLEYGKTMSGSFLTMLTRRDGGEDEY
jgi:dolichyl-phosphate-mannose--protein O-mannosyl transferase